MNPFVLPPSSQIYTVHAKASQERKRAQDEIRSLPLSERAYREKPAISQREIRNRFDAKRPQTTAATIRAAQEPRQRKQQTGQLVQERREIFLSNLLISRHQKELDRIEMQHKSSEHRLLAMDAEIADAANKTKASVNQYENQLSRERQRADELTKERIKIEQQFKLKDNAVKNMEVERTKLEYQLSDYTEYKEFMERVESITGVKPKNARELLAIFDDVASDNLFISQALERLEDKEELATGSASKEMDAIKQEIAEIERQIKAREEYLKEIQVPKTARRTNTESTDAKISELQSLVSKTFISCFPDQNTDQNPITMLQQIENDMESMHKEAMHFDHDFLVSMTKKLTEAKRKQQRELNAQKKKDELEEKTKRLLERANKPIKRRTGRPLVEKSNFTKTKKKDDTAELREKEERERIERLLFSDVFSD